MKKGLKIPILFGVIVGIVFALIFGFVEVQAIQRSAISTAAIGYLFVPIGCLVVFLVTGGLAFLFTWGIKILTGHRRYRYLIGFTLVVLPILLSLYGIWYVRAGFKAEQTVTMISEMNAPALTHEYRMLTTKKRSPFYVFEVAAIAQNKHAGGVLLDQIARNKDRSFDSKLGSPFELNGKNTKGFSVKRLVVMNPNVQEHTLVYLAKNAKDHYLLGDVAANKKTPVYILRELDKKGGYLIEWGLASNPRTPASILAKLAHSKDNQFGAQYTRSNVANNLSTPTATLKLLAKDKEPFVAKAAQRQLKKRGY